MSEFEQHFKYALEQIASTRSQESWPPPSGASASWYADAFTEVLDLASTVLASHNFTGGEPKEHSDLERKHESLKSYVHSQMAGVDNALSNLRRRYDDSLHLLEEVVDMREEIPRLKEAVTELTDRLESHLNPRARRAPTVRGTDCPVNLDRAHEWALEDIQGELESLQEHAAEVYALYRSRITTHCMEDYLSDRDTSNESLNSIKFALEDLIEE